MTIKAPLAFLLIASGLVVPVGVRADAPAGIAPGSYRNWKGQITEVVVNRSFQADNYRDIFVEPLGSVGVKVPEKPRQKEAAEALKSAKAAFIEGLRGNLREHVETRSSKPGAVEDALVIRAHLVAIDAGSENARYYLFGLGGGAVGVSIEGEIFERSSHRVLITFKQTRRSTFGRGGGTGFGELFSKTTRQLGGDVAALINAF
ncbi:MAG: DUF4410 domain-containing protein [Chthoniobacterales bacterium]|nr:DUF4410 domain-containing protein [Chthoniobacterales bacterium]